jgi:ubiquinol-cytochrome c reductase cytochrome c subunit
MTRQLHVLVAVAFLVTGACTVAAQTPTPRVPAQPAPAAAADNGKKLFVSYGCYQCHGYEAQGSSATGPRLGPRPLPYAGFSRYVRQPSGAMPPFGTRILTDADLQAIYAYVQTRPLPQPVDSLPLLRR